MKTCFSRWSFRAAVLFLTLGSASLWAVPPDDAVEPAAPPAYADFTQLTTPDALQLAYDVLKPGNHNYHNHRARAMDEIAAAAKDFGLALTERGKGGEDQKKSDTRLQLAQTILQAIRPRLVAGEQSAALEHVDKALKRLVLGLKFRGLEEEEAQLQATDERR